MRPTRNPWNRDWPQPGVSSAGGAAASIAFSLCVQISGASDGGVLFRYLQLFQALFCVLKTYSWQEEHQLVLVLRVGWPRCSISVALNQTIRDLQAAIAWTCLQTRSRTCCFPNGPLFGGLTLP